MGSKIIVIQYKDEKVTLDFNNYRCIYDVGEVN
jgi:hypothetical protein